MAEVYYYMDMFFLDFPDFNYISLILHFINRIIHMLANNEFIVKFYYASLIFALLCLRKIHNTKKKEFFIVNFFLSSILSFSVITTFSRVLIKLFLMVGISMLLVCTVHLILKFCGVKISKVYSYYIACICTLFIIAFATHVLCRVVPIEKFLLSENIEKVIRVPQKFKKTNKANEVYNSKKLRNKTRELVNFCHQKNEDFLFACKGDFVNKFISSISKFRFLFISGKFDYYKGFLRTLTLIKHKYNSCNHCFFLKLKENNFVGVFASWTPIEKSSTFRNSLKIREETYTLCKLFCPLRISENITKIKVFLEQKKICKNFLRIDYHIFGLINSKLKCKFLDLCMSAQSYCDSKKFNLSFTIILLISVAILWSNKKKHFLEFLIIFASTLVISAITIYFLKHCFERSRPLAVFGDANVNILFERSYENSFPSGHTQLAFTVGTFMFVVVRKCIILYAVLACEVGFERIYAGSHFPSDVIAGALLGIFFAYVMLFFFEKKIR
jgi:undecaprenyl-diphosphatase